MPTRAIGRSYTQQNARYMEAIGHAIRANSRSKLRVLEFFLVACFLVGSLRIYLGMSCPGRLLILFVQNCSTKFLHGVEAFILFSMVALCFKAVSVMFTVDIIVE